MANKLTNLKCKAAVFLAFNTVQEYQEKVTNTGGE